MAGRLRRAATHRRREGGGAVATLPPAKRRKQHDAAQGRVGGDQGARRAMARGGRRRLPRQCAARADRARWSPHRRMTVVNARFPWVLFLPLASITEAVGLLLLLSGRGIGWAAVLAPAIGFLAMRGPVRPRFEFMDEGVIFRRSGQSPLLPWDEIASVGLVKAGGRTVLAYRLKPGVAGRKRDPPARGLRAKGLQFAGGHFFDPMACRPPQLPQLFEAHLKPG